jgi:hypothetical protein
MTFIGTGRPFLAMDAVATIHTQPPPVWLGIAQQVQDHYYRAYYAAEAGPPPTVFLEPDVCAADWAKYHGEPAPLEPYRKRLLGEK